MKKTTIAIKTDGNGNIEESRTITAEVTGQWSNGQKVWSDEEDNQYSLHKTKDGMFYFLLEAVDYTMTTWNI